jgi:hypothetical protein
VVDPVEDLVIQGDRGAPQQVVEVPMGRGPMMAEVTQGWVIVADIEVVEPPSSKTPSRAWPTATPTRRPRILRAERHPQADG